ncbi:hypothetical protein ACOSQ2_028997 [Xanthoceras sorbifolium]
MEYVLTGGPWMITNHCLVIQRWRPNFVPGKEPILAMSVWLRFTKLPMEWIDADFLWRLGELLGKMCRVDPITDVQSRGRYARMCIEIDITKPLRSSLKVDGRKVRIEYENLGLICFKCGKIGHVMDSCREEDMDESEGVGAPIEKEAEVIKPRDTPYGPWMVVSYGRNGKSGVTPPDPIHSDRIRERYYILNSNFYFYITII